MKLIDKNGKLFGKLNVIDLCVIVVVAVLAAGTVYKFGFMDKTSTAAAMEPVTYTVRINKVRNYVFDNVREGDTLYDKTSGNAIGTITKVESQTAKDLVEMSDGSLVMGDVENRIDVTFTVEADAVVNEGGYFVNRNYELLIGSKKKFMTKYFECEGSVYEIF